MILHVWAVQTWTSKHSFFEGRVATATQKSHLVRAVLEELIEASCLWTVALPSSMVLLEKRKGQWPRLCGVLLITCAIGGYHWTLSHSLFAGCVATTDCRTIVDSSRSRHLGIARSLGRRCVSLALLFFLAVPEVGRGVSFAVLDSELALDSAILELVEDDSIQASTLPASPVINALESGGDDLKVLVGLENVVHFCAIPHALEERMDDAIVDSGGKLARGPDVTSLAAVTSAHVAALSVAVS
eukprot:s7708_g3.t1